jgi:hypothetical protein
MPRQSEGGMAPNETWYSQPVCDALLCVGSFNWHRHEQLSRLVERDDLHEPERRLNVSPARCQRNCISKTSVTGVFLKNQAACYVDIGRSGRMRASVCLWRGYQGNQEKGPLGKA